MLICPAPKIFQKSRKLKDLRTCFRFFFEKKIFGGKKKFLTFFDGFPRHFDFSTIINNFPTFLCWYVQPRKYFQKVENLRIYWPVFDFKPKKHIFFADSRICLKKSQLRRRFSIFFLAVGCAEIFFAISRSFFSDALEITILKHRISPCEQRCQHGGRRSSCDKIFFQKIPRVVRK